METFFPLELKTSAKPPSRRPTEEPAFFRYFILLITFAFLVLFLVFPLISVFSMAFQEGISTYVSALKDPENLAAIRLTLITAAIAVPLNVLFGLSAAWCITKFEFSGKNLLITLIDLPFSVSPVISGMLFVLLFGAQGLLGPFLIEHGIKIIFTPIAIVLVTLFVTFPFVARELIPVMQAQGRDEEEAAMTLGAGGLRTFWKITLPNAKWGLLYGIILCNARAMGEFGAVSVVSGHIRGLTQTMPLQVEALYNEPPATAAFALASLLTLLALFTLVIKSLIERKSSEGG